MERQKYSKRLVYFGIAAILLIIISGCSITQVSNIRVSYQNNDLERVEVDVSLSRIY